jgi:hypothetical protein
MTSNRARIHVRIDRLVLRGIDASDRLHLVSAMHAELGRILGDREARRQWAQSGRTPVLRLGTIPFTPGASGSRALGRKIAKAMTAHAMSGPGSSQ